MAKKIYVLDTSVYLTDANSFTSYGINDIVIPLKVLEEIDNHKNRQDGVGINARSIIRKLDSLRQRGNLYKGVRIGRGKGLAYARQYDATDLPKDFNITNPDNQIIATALTEKKKNIQIEK